MRLGIKTRREILRRITGAINRQERKTREKSLTRCQG
jgi:hypothetical protein